MKDIETQEFKKMLKRHDITLTPEQEGDAAFYYAMGWIGKTNWEEEQEAMDRDYQEELQEQERLRGGQA